MRISASLTLPHRDVASPQRTVTPIGSAEALPRHYTTPTAGLNWDAPDGRIVEGELLERDGTVNGVWEVTRRSTARVGRIIDAQPLAPEPAPRGAVNAYESLRTLDEFHTDRRGALFSSRA